jgi:hypothetical protein
MGKRSKYWISRVKNLFGGSDSLEDAEPPPKKKKNASDKENQPVQPNVSQITSGTTRLQAYSIYHKPFSSKRVSRRHLSLFVTR